VAQQTEPVVLSGSLDEPLSRWLWLIKWLLLIPHYVVIAVLLFIGAILGIIAFFAILFTGKYPRGIFDFNVGVLRWVWRVEFYGLYGLGTDKYPPFAMASVDSYPADLQVEYPERLNRLLIFVKWLLAIPHFIILGILRGGSGQSGGLVGILVIIAGIILLFTGKYPRGIFNFVMAINVWHYRVMGYVLLFTDTYPPFRLDIPSEQPTQ
jgi:hypothetical protein